MGKIAKFMSFLYAFLTGFSIKLIGNLFYSEILAIFSFPFIKIKKLFKIVPGLKFIITCLIFLLLAQMLSDFLNNSSPKDFLRGWATIIFSGVSIIFLVDQFIKNDKSAIYFLFGSFLVLSIFGEGDLSLELQDYDSNYFKLRFVGFLNFGFLLLSYYLVKFSKGKLTIYIFFVYALLCFYMDARSNGLVSILTSLFLYLKFYNIKLSKAKTILILMVSSVLLFTLYSYYVEKVKRYEFGGRNSQLQLEKVSNTSNPFELLYYGRTDFFVLIEAITDKPLFGHGSWALDPNFKYARLQQLLSDSYSLNDSGYIRAHSVILGVWAYAGFIGAALIFLVYFKVFKKVIIIYKKPYLWAAFPIIVFLSFDALWHFLFSPIQIIRISLPFFTSLVLVYNYKYIDFEQSHTYV